jgi:PKD repeat protein
MTIDSNTGLIQWTPTNIGNFDVTVQAANPGGTDSQSFTITVAALPPVIISLPVTDVNAGDLYSYDVEVTGIPEPTYSLTTAPLDMTIDANTGLIQWTSLFNGDIPITVQATNPGGSDSQSFIITVAAVPPVITSAPITDVNAGDLYSYDVEANGVPAPLYSLITAPAEMTINVNTGLIEWIPTQTGNFSVTVQAINPGGTDSQSFTIMVTVIPVITSLPVTDVNAGDLYSYDVEATGIPQPTFSLTTAPLGMTIDSNTGLIQWTPADIGDVNVTIQATNPGGSDSQNFTITAAAVPPVITSAAVTDVNAGELYSYDVEATGIPAAVYSLITSPAAMTIDSNTGLIQWTPADIGDVNVTVQATNAGGSDSQSFTITVAAVPPVITSAAVTDVNAGELYSYDVEATGIPQPTYSLITSPAAMTIDSNTGLIQWTPTDIGDVNVTALATNAGGTDSQNFIITVAAIPPVITSVPVTDVNAGDLYNYDVEATGIPQPIYSLTTSPLGMTIDSNTGMIQWTSADIGDVNVTVLAANPGGSDSQSFTIMVTVIPVITSVPITDVNAGDLYSYDVEATGIPQPTFSLITSPAAMTIDANTGLIQWTPTDIGDVNVTVLATNPGGSDSQSFTITIAAIPPVITSLPVTDVNAGDLYSYDVEATGIPQPTFSLTTSPLAMTIDPYPVDAN